ncbi:ribosome silencing factor [soil metagenome]
MPQTTDVPTTSVPDLDAIRAQVLTAATAASSRKATDIAILEVGPLLGITDYFLLLSTGNERQLDAALDELEGRLRIEHRRKPIGREGLKESGWVVLDYGDFVVHGFTTEQRAVYDLERLWRDAGRVPFTDPESPAEG